MGSKPASYVLQGFNGRLVAKSLHKKYYMERDREAILSVSRAVMGQRGPLLLLYLKLRLAEMNGLNPARYLKS